VRPTKTEVSDTAADEGPMKKRNPTNAVAEDRLAKSWWRRFTGGTYFRQRLRLRVETAGLIAPSSTPTRVPVPQLRACRRPDRIALTATLFQLAILSAGRQDLAGLK
jgi:hypothetical protein